MKIQVKAYVTSILEATTAANQFRKTYRQLTGNKGRSSDKGIPPENNASLQEVLYKSRQPMKAKPSSVVLNNIKQDTEIAKAQIKNQG